MKISMAFAWRQRRDAKLKAYFLERLARLSRLRWALGDQLNDLGIELLDRSIYAALLDCIQYGASNEAHSLLSIIDGVHSRRALPGDDLGLQPGSPAG